MDGWYQPGYDASGWQSGLAPIGKGEHPRAPKNLVHKSPWGDGEILLARTTFELDATDYDLYRLRTVCIQGFDVYLNGKKIESYSWWADPTENRKWPMSQRSAGLLKKGTNTHRCLHPVRLSVVPETPLEGRGLRPPQLLHRRPSQGGPVLKVRQDAP